MRARAADRHAEWVPIYQKIGPRWREQQSLRLLARSAASGPSTGFIVGRFSYRRDPAIDRVRHEKLVQVTLGQKLPSAVPEAVTLKRRVACSLIPR